MAKKLSQLPDSEDLSGDELMELSQTVSGSLSSRKSTLQKLKDWLLGGLDTAHYGSPVQSVAELTALPSADLTDKQRRYVEDEQSDYFYDAQATSGDAAPDDQSGGTGFWRKVAVDGETPASIKTKYESNADTNAYTDDEKARLESALTPEEVGALATFDMSGGADGQYVASDGNGGAALRDIPESGIEEAPQNGSGYERKDGAWAKALIQDTRDFAKLEKDLVLLGSNSLGIGGSAGSDPGMRLWAGSAGGFFEFGNNGYFGIRAVTPGSIQDNDYSNGPVVLKIDSSGQFGLGGDIGNASGAYESPNIYGNAAGEISIGTTSPSAKLDVNGTVKPGRYTVATLPTSPGEAAHAFATDGVKTGETTGSGTGVPVYYSGSQWRVAGTDQPVSA